MDALLVSLEVSWAKRRLVDDSRQTFIPVEQTLLISGKYHII